MKSLFVTAFFLIPFLAYAQPDSAKIDQKKKLYLISGTVALYGISVLAMNELWYKNYERTSFHWIDDSHEWLQMDKTGHFFFSYIAARAFSRGLLSAGLSQNKSVLWASGISMLGISTIEAFDGFSSGWGASSSDLLANASGVALFAFQSLAWHEEKIIPKFSWHPTPYAAFRPEVLGRTFPERLIKDYNGQTYWLSFNLKSLSGIKALPSWLCFSLGYGAEGMISGYNDPAIVPHFYRYRQYYLSFDADLKKINTGNKTINIILRSLNIIKVPFPALVFTERGTEFRGVYF
jgi:hypothetical protein